VDYPHYQCSDCNKVYDLDPKYYTCPECAKMQGEDEPLRGVLEVMFDPEPLELEDLIPVEGEYFPPLKVGWTPLADVPRL